MEKTAPEPIAICGLALRLPGSIHTAADFWDALVTGKDMRTPIPPSRYNVTGFNNTMGTKGSIKTAHGYFLNEDLAAFDPSFFSMGKTELERMDPQQRLLLEVTRECLENAGEVGWRGKKIGCYVGTFGEDWMLLQSRDNQGTGQYNATGGDFFLANRVSYEFDFRGPSTVIKTGCSAALIALHEACRALQMGDCEAAIVAGTNLILGPSMTSTMTEAGVLSPEGSCKTFDAAADGYARAEAITAVLVKPLHAAIKSKSPIRAIIRHVGTNSDGRSQGLTAPNGKAHEELMREVYQRAGLDPVETAFVECHGTGTPVGDPIEAGAVGNVFGRNGIYIGSVKPNFGHSEGASGVTSLIKGILALENGIIPPNIKFRNPNPKIPFEGRHLKVPVTPIPWPTDRKRRVSINSFGVGGSNAHLILDAATEFLPEPPRTIKDTNVPRLLLFSANCPSSLDHMTSNYRSDLQLHPTGLTDLSYTLSQRREHLSHRAYAISTSETASFNLSPVSKIPTAPPRICAVFTGQGAQWPQMAKGLIETFPAFRKDIRSMDNILQSLKYPPNWRIEDEILKPGESSGVHIAEISQPISTAVQIALFNVFSRAGIESGTVIGHSSGEIAAAYAAGVLSMSEAMIISFYRGLITKDSSVEGGMAAVGLGAETVSEFLCDDDVVIACENSPESVTISGSLEQLDKVIQLLQQKRPDAAVRRLKVDMPYHSHRMHHLADRYLRLVQTELVEKGINQQDPHVPFFSSVTGELITTASGFSPEYWISNLVSPVLFNQAVCRLLQEAQPPSLFLEIGPHSALAGPLRQIFSKAGFQYSYVPSMLRGADDVSTILSAFGRLYQQNINLRFESFIPEGRVLFDLPTYPWNHERTYWEESRISREWRFRNFGHHILLGQRISEITTFPCWRVALSLSDVPWLADHKVWDDIVYPFAGYISMVGEAIRQVSGCQTGYTVKNVTALAPLLLRESERVELVTVLRPQKLNDAENSSFFGFEISSYTGSIWTKHCEGLVRPKPEEIQSTTKHSTEDFLRHVPVAYWYGAMAQIGLKYGAEFQAITAVNASTRGPVAAGQIQLSSIYNEHPFIFHPIAMDACLQLVVAASVQGSGRNLQRLQLPTKIRELEISRGALEIEAIAWCRDGAGDIGVDCVAANGRNILRLRGLHLAPLLDSKETDDTGIGIEPHAVARLEWYPDFDLVDPKVLFDPLPLSRESVDMLEHMTMICIVESADRLEGLSPASGYFAQYREWLLREAELSRLTVSGDSEGLLSLTRSARMEALNSMYEKVADKPHIGAFATGMMRIFDNAKGLFTRTVNPLDLLMEGDLLTHIYNDLSPSYATFVQLLSIKKPRLRILEVGAGTGGTTEMILRRLSTRPGAQSPAYAEYTFTDVSPGFFAKAKERFSYAPNMTYKVFDISDDPIKQGFEAQSYDLIVAANVVHATPYLSVTLQNLCQLLRRDGHLVLAELLPGKRLPGYIFGNLPGWWVGKGDDREWEPWVNTARWECALRAAGFAGIESTTFTSEHPWQYCGTIVARPEKKIQQPPQEMKVIFVCDRSDEGISLRLIEDMTEAGYDVSIAKLGDALLEDTGDILITFDMENPFLETASEDQFQQFQDLIRRLRPTQNVIWLMPPAQTHCRHPTVAQTIGLFRVLRAELGVSLYTLEIDPNEVAFSQLTVQVFEKICRREQLNDGLGPDYEFAVENGVVKIGRYHSLSLKKEISRHIPGQDEEVLKTAEMTKLGTPESLRWIEKVVPCTVLDDEVEIETRAVGLNFHDIAVSYGIVPRQENSFSPGSEVSGIVTKVGRQVRHVSVGDRVCAVTKEGCLSTRVRAVAFLAAKIPDDLSFEDAATTPICFLTAVHSLLNIGNLQDGQSVLIHTASGGVGNAAIQICRVMNAKIYVTVGTPEKAKFMTDHFHIPAGHIFNSRSTSFLSDIMRVTDHQGVDLVLNTVPGELLHASWQCVAEFGKLIELGKRDHLQGGILDLQPFLANRSYHGVDVEHYMEKKPEKTGRMLERIIEMYKQGLVEPIHPVTVFDASDAQLAIRHLAKRDHIGKVVVRFPEEVFDIPSVPQTRHVAFDSQAGYLLVGGLGGLGRPIARWMVDNGARCLTFLSRSAGSGEADKAFAAELNSMGCEVIFVQGDVQNANDVSKARQMTPKEIKGVFHLAMVLNDNLFLNMTFDQWNGTIGPKVKGAWNLHNAFIDLPLDFFIMFSSLVAHADVPGQSNYAAACSFLESFAQYRHSLNLAASVLSICAISGVGYVSENPIAQRTMRSKGIYFLSEKDLLDCVELAIQKSPAACNLVQTKPTDSTSWKFPSHILMGLHSETSLDDPSCRTSWRHNRRMGTFYNNSTQSKNNNTITTTKDSTQPLRSFLNQCTTDPSLLEKTSTAEYFAQQIGAKLMSALLRDESDVDINKGLVELGLDSLIATELRVWIRDVFRVEVSVLEIMAFGTLRDVGGFVLGKVKKDI